MASLVLVREGLIVRRELVKPCALTPAVATTGPVMITAARARDAHGKFKVG